MKSSGHVNRKAIRAVLQACRYDPYRSRLLNEARAKKETETGRPYLANRSLIVHDALDLLLKAEGLLPPDAPLLSELAAETSLPAPSKRKKRGSR